MPMKLALRKCPQAVFLPADHKAYEEVSTVVMETLRSVDDVVVEVLGWDEAFVGAETDDPEALARSIQAAILEATQLHASVGIGDNKLRAKLATGFGKPAGMFRLTRANWFEVMGERPTEALWGIGRKTAKKLADLGIDTVNELAAADPEQLAARLGPTMGPWYVQLGRGIGSRTVDASPYVPRSRGRETTFQQNLENWDEVTHEVSQLASRVTQDVLAEGRDVVRVGVKVRYAPFVTVTHAMKLAASTRDGGAIEAAALTVLQQFSRGRPVRLLGVWAEMEPPQPAS